MLSGNIQQPQKHWSSLLQPCDTLCWIPKGRFKVREACSVLFTGLGLVAIDWEGSVWAHSLERTADPCISPSVNAPLGTFRWKGFCAAAICVLLYCMLVLQAEGLVLLHMQGGCSMNNAQISLHVPASKTRMYPGQLQSLKFDLQFSSDEQTGPCGAQSLTDFLTGLLLWGCISCFHALAVGLLITREDERSTQEGKCSFKMLKKKRNRTESDSEKKGFWSFNKAYLDFTTHLQPNTGMIGSVSHQKLSRVSNVSLTSGTFFPADCNTSPELRSHLSVGEVKKQQLVCSYYHHLFPPVRMQHPVTTSGSHGKWSEHNSRTDTDGSKTTFVSTVSILNLFFPSLL